MEQVSQSMGYTDWHLPVRSSLSSIILYNVMAGVPGICYLIVFCISGGFPTFALPLLSPAVPGTLSIYSPLHFDNPWAFVSPSLSLSVRVSHRSNLFDGYSLAVFPGFRFRLRVFGF